MASFKNAAVLASMVFFAKTAVNELARGWGSNIDWIKLDTALRRSKEEKKPIMLVMHKTGCSSCVVFKPKFAAHKGIAELSSKFLMVNTMDDEVPRGAMYSPDGRYFPRILFMGPKGTVMPAAYNKHGNRNYRYYYGSPDSVLTTMKYVLRCHEKKYGKVE